MNQHPREIHIRLKESQIEQMKAGRVLIDVEHPAPATVTEADICPATQQTIRMVPAGKNNWRNREGSCNRCRYYFKKYGMNYYTCTKETFKGNCVVYAADNRLCDLFQPKYHSVFVEKPAPVKKRKCTRYRVMERIVYTAENAAPIGAYFGRYLGNRQARICNEAREWMNVSLSTITKRKETK